MLCQLGQGGHEDLIFGRVANAANKTPVNLNHIESQRLEVGEGRVTSAKIVNRHAGAKRCDLPNDLLNPVRALHLDLRGRSGRNLNATMRRTA